MGDALSPGVLTAGSTANNTGIDMERVLPGLRRTPIIAGAGHWIPQELGGKYRSAGRAERNQ